QVAPPASAGMPMRCPQPIAGSGASYQAPHACTARRSPPIQPRSRHLGFAHPASETTPTAASTIHPARRMSPPRDARAPHPRRDDEHRGKEVPSSWQSALTPGDAPRYAAGGGAPRERSAAAGISTRARVLAGAPARGVPEGGGGGGGEGAGDGAGRVLR